MMFTPHQADAVRRALRKGLGQEDPQARASTRASAPRSRIKAERASRPTRRTTSRAPSARSTKKNLRVDLGAALAGPEGRPTADVDGPAVAEARD